MVGFNRILEFFAPLVLPHNFEENNDAQIITITQRKPIYIKIRPWFPMAQNHRLQEITNTAINIIYANEYERW